MTHAACDMPLLIRSQDNDGVESFVQQIAAQQSQLLQPQHLPEFALTFNLNKINFTLK